MLHAIQGRLRAIEPALTDEIHDAAEAEGRAGAEFDDLLEVASEEEDARSIDALLLAMDARIAELRADYRAASRAA
jgi:hypothetical protein